MQPLPIFNFRTFHHSQKRNTLLVGHSLISSSSNPWQPLIYFVSEFAIVDISIQCVVFCDWLLLLSIKYHTAVMHTALCIIQHLLFFSLPPLEYYCVYGYTTFCFFIIWWTIFFFYFKTNINNAALNILV